ncbi:hypothetical protein B0H19DRAFT_1154788 [Mycena capillaripes]|nr:hypothetical protein B0H19DRAFT_1154788 [Mycena capillaripes]
MSVCFQCGAVFPVSAEGEYDPAVTPGTRHRTLLSTNEPPEDSELGLVRSVIANAGVRLTRLDTDIAQLRDRLRQLEEDHSALSSFRTQSMAILSPLRRIPAEVLSEIFLWTLPSLREGAARGRFQMADSPWSMTHVSRRWRAVAILNPSLWSTIVISYQIATNPSYSLFMLKAQMARAQRLKIHFDGTEQSDSRSQIEVFECLVCQSSRWEDLSLALPLALVPLLASVRDRVPLLQRVWIEWSEAANVAGVDSMDCFRVAPSLVDLSVDNEYGFIPFSFPIHNLTRYQFDAPWEVHQAVLKFGQNLVEARMLISEESWPTPGEAIHPPALRRLFSSHLQVLDYLRTPCLEEIAIDYVEEEVPTLRTRLESLVLRSRCSLRRLSLLGPCAVDPIGEILKNIPSVVELMITVALAAFSDSTNALISYLSVGDPPGPVVAPQLRGIFVACRDETRIDYTQYLEMLKSRRKAVNCAVLESAVLLWGSNPGPDLITIQGLHALRQEGLQLSLLNEIDHQTEAADLWRSLILHPLWN